MTLKHEWKDGRYCGSPFTLIADSPCRAPSEHTEISEDLLVLDLILNDLEYIEVHGLYLTPREVAALRRILTSLKETSK